MGLVNSTNPKIMAENIKKLESMVESGGSDIPAHDSTDAGKYLGVDSSGDLEFSNPLPAHPSTDAGKYLGIDSSGDLEFSTVPSDLPDTTGASTGDVLGLTGEGKIPGWITPSNSIDYSTSEQDTGRKWIDGKSIYQKTFTLSSGSLATRSLLIPTDDLAVENIIDVYGSLYNDTESRNYVLPYFRATLNESILISVDTRSGLLHVELTSGITTYTELEDISVTVFYTKPTPTPEPTLTKKKTTKKGD